MGDFYVPEIVKEVSEHTNIRQDLVAMILDGYVDVATEHLVNDEEFNILGLVTVKANQWGETKIEGKFDKPAHKRLVPKISWRIKELRKIRESHTPEEQKARRITRLNWRDFHSLILAKKKTKKDVVKPQNDQDRSDNTSPIKTPQRSDRARNILAASFNAGGRLADALDEMRSEEEF